MADRTPYSFGAAPLQDPIVPKLYLTDAWRDWFVDLQRQFLVRWEDMRFPSQGINPPGAAADPARDPTTGLLVFSPLMDNVIAGVAQLPHAWLPGSNVHPHIHLRNPTVAAGQNSRWQFAYDIANPNGDFSNALGTYTALPTVTVPNPANTARHQLAGLGDLPMVGFRESTVILWQVTRLAGTDALDTDGGITLLEFDIHFQAHKQGTVQEYPT